jgi:hypothetical protein
LRSWLRCLIPASAVLLLGAAEPTQDQLRLRVLVVVYPETFAAAATRDDVENVWREVAESAEFVARASQGRLHLDLERAVVERPVPREDFEENPPGQFWLNDYAGSRHVVEDDLLAQGHARDRFDVVAVFYAWENRPSHTTPFGAASIGVNRILGKAPYLAVPMVWNPSTLSSYFEHELLHCLESMFEDAGAGFPHLHNGWAFEATYGVDQAEWNAWVLENAPWDAYLAKPGRWGTIVGSSTSVEATPPAR